MRWKASLLGAVVLALSLSTTAEAGLFDGLGRWLGLGWGDGYHTGRNHLPAPPAYGYPASPYPQYTPDQPPAYAPPQVPAEPPQPAPENGSVVQPQLYIQPLGF